MKKTKIAILSAIVLVLLLMNVRFKGNAEGIYLSITPEQAQSSGQCWMNFATGNCTCPDQRDCACAAICHGAGVTCGEVVVEE
jgi:hypothetical protein